jgi:hypothetical protein
VCRPALPLPSTLAANLSHVGLQRLDWAGIQLVLAHGARSGVCWKFLAELVECDNNSRWDIVLQASPSHRLRAADQLYRMAAIGSFGCIPGLAHLLQVPKTSWPVVG